MGVEVRGRMKRVGEEERGRVFPYVRERLSTTGEMEAAHRPGSESLPDSC